jgi:hypothetical protein
MDTDKTRKEIRDNLSALRIPADEKAEASTYRKKTHGQQVWLTWLTGLAMLAAAIYAAIAAKQLCVVSAQLTEMKDATIAAKDSANAAKMSADAAISSSRAWIVPLNENQVLQSLSPINVFFKNVGKSPAVRVYAKAEYSTDVPSKLTQGCEHLGEIKWKTETPLLLPDGPAFEITFQNLPPAWIDNPSKPGSLNILESHGCVWYWDVVANLERTTEFCYMATATTWRQRGPAPSSSFQAAQSHRQRLLGPRSLYFQLSRHKAISASLASLSRQYPRQLVSWFITRFYAQAWIAWTRPIQRTARAIMRQLIAAWRELYRER